MTQTKHFLPASVSREKVPILYRWLAPIYDLAGVLLGDKSRRIGLERAQIEDGERVLELGVGTGLTFEEIVRRNPGGWNEGIDITEEMLQRARRRMARMDAQNYRLVHADALCLTYDDDSFDCLISTYMLDLLSREQMITALTEWKRVLKPDGRLVLVYQAPGRCWYQKIWDACYRVVPVVLGGCRGISPEPILREMGLTVARKQFVSRLTIPQEILVATS